MNFDWDVWINNAPLGLTAGGARTTTDSNTVIANTTPATDFTGLHFADGDVVLGTAGAFSLAGSYDFQAAAFTATPVGPQSHVVSENSKSTLITNGLNLQVAAWSGDGDATTIVNFNMSSIQVVISGTVVASSP